MAKKTVDESPMMKQFRELKEKHPDAMLLFRCGDFYETYGDDAKEAAKVLGITLTWRTPSKRHAPGDYSDAMAGFPHHALDTYLPKLIRAGKRVAICDQLDPPPTPKVKRGSTETISNNTNNQKSSTTMATKNMVNNENKNAAQQQVNNEVESVCVGEMTLDAIQPAMVPIEGSEYQVKGDDGKDVTFGSVAPNIGYEPAAPTKQEVAAAIVKAANEGKATTMPLSKHGTLVIGGVPKREEKPVTLKRKVTLKTKTTEAEPSATKESELAGLLPPVHLAIYTTKRGEKAPRIVGFKGEDDPRWKPINDEKQKAVEAYNKAKKKDSKAKMQSCPFGPAWLTDRETGEKCYCMTLGVRYMDVAQQLVAAYNTADRDLWHQAEQAVRSLKQGIVSDYQAEKAARRAEREAQKAAKAQPQAAPAAPAMSSEEQAAFELFKRFMAGDKEAVAQVNTLLKAA